MSVGLVSTVSMIISAVFLLVTIAAAIGVGALARGKGVWLGVTGLALLAVGRVAVLILNLLLGRLVSSRDSLNALLILQNVVSQLLYGAGVVMIALGFIQLARSLRGAGPVPSRPYPPQPGPARPWPTQPGSPQPGSYPPRPGPAQPGPYPPQGGSPQPPGGGQVPGFAGPQAPR